MGDSVWWVRCTLRLGPQMHLFKWSWSMQVLDSSTLKNLDVLVNNCTGTLEGTLLLKLDHCCTSAGKSIHIVLVRGCRLL